MPYKFFLIQLKLYFFFLFSFLGVVLEDVELSQPLLYDGK